MKKIILLLTALGLICQTRIFSQERIDSVHMQATSHPSAHPLVLVNGFETDLQSIILCPDHIEAINILNSQTAIDQYGQKAKEGVIIITTKPAVGFYKLIDFVNAPKNLNSSVRKIELNGKLLADINKLLIDKTALVNTMISADWKLDNNCELSSVDTLVINAAFPNSRK